ncbi:MAG: leucine-rich repeat domain-containing protein [Ruminococcus flavefaciens]|nr:leucine-rich repeat domain-containing protein [Ruminococcus flavefaciens]
MAFHSGFFDSKGLDRMYTAEDFTTYLSSLICNGILDTYGDCFDLTSTGEGRQVIVGTGKAWINGHYFVNDEPHLMDFAGWQDPTFPRYVAIVIACDTSDGVRNVWLESVIGQPAENPQIPELPTSETRTNLFLYAVRINPTGQCITRDDWWDYRSDENVCGYCRCILGKCRVTEMIQEIAELKAKINELQPQIEDLSNVVVETGKVGDNVRYSLRKDGKAIMTGTGDIWEYGEDTSRGNSPFYCNKSLKYMTIEDGVTSLTDKFFFGTIMHVLTVPESVVTVGVSVCEESDVSVAYYGGAVIGERMFANDDALVMVSMTKNVRKISDNALFGCVNLMSATYDGTIDEWNEIEKSENWTGESGSRSSLEKIQCTDGYLAYDWHTHIWNEVRE